MSQDPRGVARQAEWIYAHRLKTTWEQSNPDDVVAIEPVSGEHLVGATRSEAIGAARRVHPQPLAYAGRLGHRAAVHLGASRRSMAAWIGEVAANNRRVAMLLTFHSLDMKIAYSPDADVLTIQLREGRPSDSRDIAEGIIVHVSVTGQPLEIEILDASHVLQKKDVEVSMDALFSRV